MTANLPTSRALSLLDGIFRFGSSHRRGAHAPEVPPVVDRTGCYRRLLPTDLLDPEPIWMTSAVLDAINATVGSMPAEQGGMLGGRRSQGVVTDFCFDDEARASTATYSPNVPMLNSLLKERWNPSGIDFLGFVHSHPAGYAIPSSGDRVYSDRILGALPAVDRLLLPIVQSGADVDKSSFHSFVVTRTMNGVEVQQVPLVTVREAGPPATLDDPAFERVREAYDLEATAATRLVVVGVGGAAAFVETMARSGVGEFVLIDPDIIELPNIGTQQVYRRDVGRPKVDAIAERILDINPHARVVGIVDTLDALDDDMMRRLVHRPLPGSGTTGPDVSLLCACTDDFWAQARVNRLALHLGVPVVAAQVYERGHGVEVSFHVPGRSTACGRCVLGGRYRAYLGEMEFPNVTSHGTPMWATERLNEIKAQVALAIIHGTSTVGGHPSPARQRYTDLLDLIERRNLVQVRLDPDAPLPAFGRAFAGADQERVVTDDTLWLPQEPEHPDTGFEPCGDCGGTGDLEASAGSFVDTRLLRSRSLAR